MAQVFDALSYYLDHKEEIERQIQEAQTLPDFPDDWEQIAEGVWRWRPTDFICTKLN